MSDTPERRFYIGEVRAVMPEEGGQAHIIGSAAVFNHRSENLGGFREIIKPGAFNNCLTNDVRGLFNHDANIILGRTLSGTMTLSVTDSSLDYDILAPDTQMVRDMVVAPLLRGDVSQSSFQFTVGRDGDHWYVDDEGIVIREIITVSRLFDVGPVVFPAYPDTSSAKRDMQEFMSQKELQKAITSKRSRERLLTIIGVGG